MTQDQLNKTADNENDFIELFITDPCIYEIDIISDYADIIEDYVSWIKSNINNVDLQLELISFFLVFSFTHPNRSEVYKFVNSEKERMDRLYVKTGAHF